MAIEQIEPNFEMGLSTGIKGQASTDMSYHLHAIVGYITGEYYNPLSYSIPAALAINELTLRFSHTSRGRATNLGRVF
jgi:hypothetical protein